MLLLPGMLKSSTIQHLRFPFSLLLMPVFVFAASQYLILNWQNAVLVFIILHFLLYPASNGYNSFYDKDEGSIGGVKNPLPVSRELLWTAWLLDLLALGLSLLLSWRFAIMVLIYSLVSRAYSYPAIRLKRYPILSVIILVLFQGVFTYGMVTLGIQQLNYFELMRMDILWPSILTGLFLTGFYPLTQIYQHEEDSQRGDITISLLLGIRGTFLFSGFTWLICIAGFFFYFRAFFSLAPFWAFLIFMSPVLAYFLYWFYQVNKDSSAANFTHAHRFMRLSTSMMTLFFVGFYALWFQA